MVGNEACGPRLLLTELGMFMNIAPPGDQLVLDLGGALADFLFKIGRGRLRRRRLRPARGEERCENGGAKRMAHVALHQPTFPGYPRARGTDAAVGVGLPLPPGDARRLSRSRRASSRRSWRRRRAPR